MDSDDRALCATTARWLQGCSGALGTLAIASACGALVLLLSKSTWPAAVVLALTPAERLLALRLRFDAGLFADLARGETDIGRLDGALQRLGLRRAEAPTKPPRGVAERVAGTRHLLRQHAALALLQFLLVAGQAAWPLLAGPTSAAR